MFVVPNSAFVVRPRRQRPLSLQPLDVFGLCPHSMYDFGSAFDALYTPVHDFRLPSISQAVLEAERQRIAAYELATIRRQLEAEEHERWIRHQVALRVQREQIIRARRQRLLEEERRRQAVEQKLRLRQVAQEELARLAAAQQDQRQSAFFGALLLAQAIVEAQSSSESPTQSVAPTSKSKSHVRFAVPPLVVPPVAQSVSPELAFKPQLPLPAPLSSASSVRIPIRESKGKASAHVRITSHLPEPLPAADAIAALSILEADLDAVKITTPIPALRHQLTRLLEQVDAIESGGHEAVRDVRRALVQRLEGALESLERSGVPEVERPKQVGIKIIDKSAEKARGAATPESVPTVEGYDVDDYLEPTAASVDKGNVDEPTSKPHDNDLTAVIDSAEDPASSVHVAPAFEDAAPSGSLREELADSLQSDRTEASKAISATPLATSYPPAQFFDLPAHPPTASISSPAPSVKSLSSSSPISKSADLESDWASERHSDQDTFEVL